MKKLHALVLKTFIGPFLMTFAVAIFILLMQFLWKYIDDLVGKGLEWTVIGQLMLYMSFNLVSMALPLAILVSSIMTYGSLGEHYEIVAAKAAGISLTRLLVPLLITALFISVGAFFFSNNVLPKTNLKAGSLLYDVTNAKPALNINPGVFYNGIDGFSIRIGGKDNDGQTIHNILIYDHSLHLGNLKMVLADSGKMVMSKDKNFLYVTLFNGNGYEELRNGRGDENSQPLVRTKFSEELFTFDLSSFKMSRTNEALFMDNRQMLSVKQLKSKIDSLRKRVYYLSENYGYLQTPYFSYNRDSAEVRTKVLGAIAINPLDSFDSQNRMMIFENALSTSRSVQSDVANNANEMKLMWDEIDRNLIEYNRRFTWSIACFVLFLIGAPLGAIIRKGGMGTPILVAILFFLVYHIISISGEKMAKEGSATPFSGMWAATFILFPVGLFLIYKATRDSALLDTDAYSMFFKRLITKRKK